MIIDTINKKCSRWIPDIENNCVVDRNGRELLVYHMTDRYWIHVSSSETGIDITIEDFETGTNITNEDLSVQDFIMSEALEYIENNIPPKFQQL